MMMKVWFFLGMRSLLMTKVGRVGANLELERGICIFSFIIKKAGDKKAFCNFELIQNRVFQSVSHSCDM